MRWKIIVVNAGIVLIVTMLAYALLAASLKDLVSNPSERKREVAQALRAAGAQLALDALRLERWLESQANLESTRSIFSKGTAAARSEAATVTANRLRDIAALEPAFTKMAPSLVLIVDAQGVALGRNGSALMRGERVAEAHPSLAKVLQGAQTASAVWLNRQRQEQMLVSYAPVRGDNGAPLGALVVGTPLNDDRLARTSELTSGQALMIQIPSERTNEVERTHEIIAVSGASAEVVTAATDPDVARAVRQALSARSLSIAPAILAGQLFGALPLDGYQETPAVLISALPASRVGSIGGVLWPLLAVSGLGILLVMVGGTLLGNYISGPISELEDGLLAIINGNSGLRFQIEHAELGGLVFRVNSLLNALMDVPEDTTDEQGRPSKGPSSRDFQEALSVDESSVTGEVDPEIALGLAKKTPEQYYRQLFEEYLDAKRKLGDPVDHISFAAFVARIRASEEELREKHGRPVRYHVELRGSAVILNAVPVELPVA